MHLTTPRRRLALLAAASAVTLSAGVLTTMTAAAAAAACRVDYRITNQWSGGFGADVTVTNLGDPVNGWTLGWSFAAGQQVVQAWNATVSQSGAQVSARDAGYNAALGTGGTANFGFNGSWNNASNPVPAAFTLNGTACTGAPSTTPPPSTPPPTTPPPTTPPPTTPPPTTPPPTTPPPTTPPAGAKQMEDLDRGLVSVRSGSGNLVSWRLLGTETTGVTFNLYRGGTKVNASPITGATTYLDSGAAAGSAYTVRAVVNGAEQAASAPALQFANGYLDVPIQPPPGGTTPSGEGYSYSANDASVGDLDGDGRYEFVLKWDPSNAKDNSQSGYTGNVYVDAYTLTGARLWRIDLGRNIRAGAHYTQFQVYDYDGDGDAEVAMKTADGTRSGTGQVIGNGSADHRNSSGYVLAGPEYLTMFDGRTGAALSTVDYDPPRGTVSSWGDSYGNRVDRFLAGTAYLDGQRPSLIMARGYYTRAVVAAWDFRDGTLRKRWTFDSNASGNGAAAGQGNHQLSVADVDNDGRQEIVYGAATIDDNGRLLYSTGNGHGDALHVGDLDPFRSGLEVFKVDEDGSKPSSWMADARTGQIIWQTAPSGDNGRGVSGDVWAGSPGAESWSSAVDGLLNTRGQNVGRKPSSANFLIWWDGDPVRELLDATKIDKYGTGGETRLLTGSGVASNNGTKSTPALSADLLGDWREEVVWRTSDSTALRIYSTPVTTGLRLPTLMHDPQYRVAVAWQNTAYNQPPHPGYFLGDGMSTPPAPNIYLR
ncbi:MULTISPECIES: cellulose binding domain-containing protein [unclassified Micromonospora]|uniref:rhamnogalacturonan lyase family protein n=1 Tax=unclassified Micromonospora TaxID=2617518 RepID=UPI001B395AD3|nr:MULTISPECIES: cellulose binding domain-containing protein [unclassified Micromonospora]MBQ1045179.1 cellulose binding domain-containing protein [Micromonospora sp. C72]MBQ1058512.1 cellulose binding domain-containing protein [Micromonospora sp. C32]